MTKSELEQKIRKYCSNMVYIFIKEEELQKGIFGKWNQRIWAKKTSQVNYLKGLSVAAGMAGSMDDIYAWIQDEIAKTYAPLYNPVTKQTEKATPTLILYHLALGENIGGMNWSAGLYGVPSGTIGKTYTQDFGTNGVTVDATSGALSINGTQVNSTSNYQQIMTDGAGKYAYKKVTSSYYDPETRTTYMAKLNKDGQWYAYSTTNQAGRTTKVKTGTVLTAADGDLWDNVNNLIANLQDMMNSFVTWLTGGETAASLSPAQVEDGWVAEEDNSGIATAALIAGGLLITGVVLNSDKKGKKTNNIKEA